MDAIDVRVYAAIIIQVNNSFGYYSAESSLIEKRKNYYGPHRHLNLAGGIQL